MGQGNLTDEEYSELLTLEYVLTYGYTDDEKTDEIRIKNLMKKKDKEILNIGKFCLSL